MENADNPGGLAGQLSPAGESVDLLIIGGGVMGLWAAIHAERLGIRALLIDAQAPGSGASSGLLGALMAHMPDRWSDKKQFQFDCLISLEEEIARIEAETGLSCGYRRSGRLVPLPKPHLRTIALRHEQEAQVNWRVGERQFHWHVLDDLPEVVKASGWLDQASGEYGFVHDTLAAKVSPRRFGAALRASLAKARHVKIREGCDVADVDAANGAARLTSGEVLHFGHAIIAAGHRSFPLLADVIGYRGAKPLGQPVKGQAALLRAGVDVGLPLVFLDGLYLVPHEDGHVAIGSTSEDVFDTPFDTDAQIENLIERARAISPALADAPVVERWAGLRPKAIGRDPMVGAHPDHPRIIALTGGFKVSFGIAHRVARAALAPLAGDEAGIPASFSLMHHLAEAGK